MTASVRHHRLVRRLAVAALAIGTLGLTAPLAAAESFSSATGSAPDAVHAPAKRSAPAAAPKPAKKPADEATARPDVENKSETKGE